MKYCPKCKKRRSTEEENCPVCGEKLLVGSCDSEEDEETAAEMIATMTAIGLF